MQVVFFFHLKIGVLLGPKTFSVMGLSLQIQMQNREETNTFETTLLTLWVVFFSKDSALKPTFVNKEN